MWTVLSKIATGARIMLVSELEGCEPSKFGTGELPEFMEVEK